MNLNFKNITFVIVTFKSEKIVYECINSLPKDSYKIVIENSKNIKLKRELEIKYDNIEVIINENIGMGASNNIGIKKSKTKYTFILNPDTKFNSDTLQKIFEASESINDFAILSPINSDPNYPNYEISSDNKNINENIISVDYVDGFSMLINKEKFKDEDFFDESFFLYLENTDLCLRTKKRGQNIFIIKNSFINHAGAGSIVSKDLEYLRNWHWMWSKFYFNKKHYGYLNAFIKIISNLLSAMFKYVFYLILFNSHKKKIYLMRILGLYNSIIGKKSWFRVND
jgi:GT2 family glycosyltransferase